MNLVLAARSTEPLRGVAAEIESLGASVLAQVTDVTDDSQCRALIDRAVERFGQIDFLILNAGVGMWIRFEEIRDPSIFQSVMDTNYFGAVNCVRWALPHLKQARGTIVAILSLQAVLGVPDHTAYTASKHALKGFLDALELELADRIHIVSILPGWVSGTSLRANAFKGERRSAPKHDRQAVSVERCASIIIRAMESHRREVFIPTKLRYLYWLKHISPSLMKWIIGRAIRKQGA